MADLSAERQKESVLVFAGEDELRAATATIRAEIGAALGGACYRDWAQLARAVHAARSVHVTGQGRSGLIARAFAQRLMHLGLSAHVVGDVTAPAVGPGDVLIAITASGATPVTVHHAQRAKDAGAQVAVITTAGPAKIGGTADVSAAIPPLPRGHASQQFATTLFCQAAGLLLDAVCLTLQRALQQADRDLQARHSNLE